MNIFILHCHFERGGVTQVVENHVRALRRFDQVRQITLVAGPRTGGLSAETRASVRRIAIDDFDYDLPEHVRAVEDRSQQLASNLQRQLAEAGTHPDDSVLHWHNHSLGKNTAAPAVIRRLVAAGWRILLQIHDFAEDYRPQLYRGLIEANLAKSKAELDALLYPVAAQVHYATLTRADAGVLRSLGVPQSHTHCLPNGVRLHSRSQHDGVASLAAVRRVMNLPEGARWCLYPVRGIRRKNVAEFLLLSRWIPDDMFAGLTLCPTTPVEKRSYERWRQMGAKVAPRAVFDAAHHRGVTYADNLAAAEFAVSTSVAEGFGMAYLEPWLAGRAVIARRLPTVTDDFQAAGLELSTLYDSIPVPGDADWLRQSRLERKQSLEDAWSAVPAQFRPDLDDDSGDTSDTIDFAMLTPSRQAEVLTRSSKSEAYDSALKALSSRLINQLRRPPDDELIDRNSDIVRREYAIDRQGDQLMSIYQQLLDAGVSGVDAPQRAGLAVDSVAAARPFYPCRTERFPHA